MSAACFPGQMRGAYGGIMILDENDTDLSQSLIQNYLV